MNLLQSLRRSESRMSLDDYAGMVTDAFYNGVSYPLTTTYGDRPGEKIEANFASRVQGAYKTSGVVFACQLARLLVFSEARFQFQQLRNGRPGDLFGSPALRLLETPWPNGSTGELLARMIQDVDLSGNAYIRRTGPTADPRLERLRPDWVTIVLGSNSDLLNAEVLGYLYDCNGDSKDVVSLAASEVAHWSPIPDPVATYRGMSWMSTVLVETAADKSATKHKLQFFDNAATPNLAIVFDPTVKAEQAEKLKTLLEVEHTGWRNAYKTLYLGGGADAKTIGNSFREMSFKETQGAGETRIAAAAGVPPVIVGLSEGLQSATYSNYAQARRRFADGTIRPLWRSAAAALQAIVPAPERSRLWYDDRDIPFLAEDVKDAAEIQETRARTIAALVRDGFEPGSVVKAVMSEDLTLLQHTGALSVQLVKPGASPSPNGSSPSEPAQEAPV